MSNFKRLVIDQRHVWWPALKRGVRKTALSCAIGLCAMTLVAIVFWDADFYVARERWETFKHAMFGEWEGGKRVHATDPQAETDPQQLIEALFAQYDWVHLFATKPVEGTHLIVDTGARFKKVTDILNAKPAQQWCDVSNQQSAVRHQIQLAVQHARLKPQVTDTSTISDAELALLGISRKRIAKLASTHCQFDFFHNNKTEA